MRLLDIEMARLLENLQGEAIASAERLRAQRNPLGAYDFQKGNKEIEAFFLDVKGHETRLGKPRVLRILRHQTPATHPFDRIDVGTDLETHVRWIEAVQRNIEYELDVIDRRRTLLLTVASVVAATAAALASAAALFK